MPAVKKNKPKNSSKKNEEKIVEEAVISGQLKKRIKKQNEKKEAKAARQRGLLFIKHLPHGFFEEQLGKYFEQFGAVTRLRLCRSRRTGGSKGYAFVEFQFPEVAQVAAETMNNYLMFKKVVKAAYIPPEKQHFNYFKTNVRKVTNKAGKPIYVSRKTAAIQRKVKKHNDWNEDTYQKRTIAQFKKLTKLNNKLQHLGIDFTQLSLTPKKLSDAVTADETVNTSLEEETAKSPKQKTVLKRKSPKESQTQKKLKYQKGKKDMELEDLLGTTIENDSEDEDYIALPDSDKDSTDEDLYVFSDLETESDSEDEEEIKKKSKVKMSKNTKPVKADGFEQLIKRKQKIGGIQKLIKKAEKKPIKNKAKAIMQLETAKTIAKPLSKIEPHKKTQKKNNKNNKKKV